MLREQMLKRCVFKTGGLVHLVGDALFSLEWF